MVVLRHLIMQMMPLLGEWYGFHGMSGMSVISTLNSIQSRIKELTGDQAHPDSDYEVE